MWGEPVATVLGLVLGLGAPAAASEPPTGPQLAAHYVRPAHGESPERACSFHRPVCVHGSPTIGADVLLSALRDLEAADMRLVDVLGLPRPLQDGALGGGPEFDLYLLDSVRDALHQPAERPTPSASPEGRRPQRQRSSEATGRRTETRALRELVVVERDAPQPQTWDSATSFALVDFHAGGCTASNLIARAYASAIGWRVDAAELSSLRDSRSAYLAELVAPCGAVSTQLIDEFQTHPERAVTDGTSRLGPATGFMFSWFLDGALGAGLGRVPIALSSIGPQRTPADHWEWVDEPDLFDALRATLRVRPSPRTVSDLLLEFAVSRLFWGDRDDGTHPPAASFAGSFGRVRFDWTIPFATLPRRVMPARPIEPTGATYIWVDLEGVTPGAHLGFRAEWESPVVFRWALVRVEADGRERSRVLVTPQAKSTSAERHVEDLDGLAGIAVVGVNAGDVSDSEPFDPDPVPFEPHACAVTLVRGD